MQYELISGADYDTFPADPEQRFLALEEVCRRNLLGLIRQETGEYFDETIRFQYMSVVAAAAEELGIEGLFDPVSANPVMPQLNRFNLEVSRITTRLRLRMSAALAPYTVELSNRNKARIRMEVERLRGIVDESDLDERTRTALYAKLDELLAEIDRPRARYTQLMAAIAIISVTVASGTSFLADAPTAITTITSLIGADKQAEVKEQERLRAPERTRALPAPEKTPAFSRELEDEIPF